MLRIVAVTGMPGAGKSTATKALLGKGWTKIVMGDVIREETKRRGLEPNSKNTGDVMKDLRNQKGEAAVAELCLETIKESRSERVVVDGIRSMSEVVTFRRSARVLLIGVHASPDRRFTLLRERGRSDDPITREMFEARDQRELGVGIGTAIAMADEVVSNEHSTPELLASTLADIVDDWLGRDADRT